MALKEYHLKEGRNRGILSVLRFAKSALSPAKFKEFEREFNYQELNARYPESPYEKARKTSPRCFNERPEENVTPQGDGH